jgi:hypothetical protein
MRYFYPWGERRSGVWSLHYRAIFFFFTLFSLHSIHHAFLNTPRKACFPNAPCFYTCQCMMYFTLCPNSPPPTLPCRTPPHILGLSFCNILGACCYREGRGGWKNKYDNIVGYDGLMRRRIEGVNTRQYPCIEISMLFSQSARYSVTVFVTAWLPSIPEGRSMVVFSARPAFIWAKYQGNWIRSGGERGLRKLCSYWKYVFFEKNNWKPIFQ